MKKKEREARTAIYDNEELARLIDLYVRGELDRQILKRHLIDVMSYDELAKEVGYSLSWVKQHIHKAEKQLFKRI